MEDIYTFSMFLSVLSFALATAFTPGPNNLMLLSSGLTFGYKRTLAHIIGVAVGFPMMVLAVGFGLGSVLEAYPEVFTVLKVVGITYLVWMAWHMAQTTGEINTQTHHRIDKPFTLMQAALFQWVNPKAWVMAVTATTSFTTYENMVCQIFIVALVYLGVGVFSTHTWALGGVFLQQWLQNPKTIRYFNKAMALLIVFSVVPFMLK